MGGGSARSIAIDNFYAAGEVKIDSLAVDKTTKLTGVVTATAANDIRGVALHATQGAYAPSTNADMQTLLGRVTSTLFTGITSLAQWLGLLAGKTADAAALAEVNATTAGAGYSNITDSLEANRDNIGTAGVGLTSVALANATSDAVLADAIWNAATASYGSAGTYGFALEAAGTAADPWLTVLPGGYAPTTAGYIIGTNLDAKVSTIGGGAITEAGIATAVWKDLMAGGDFDTAASIGKLLKDDVNATISSRSTLTQAEVTGGAYALNHASFAFNASLDFSTTQKTSLNSATPAVTVSDKAGFSLSTAGIQAIIEACFTYDATANYAGAAAGSLVKEVADNSGVTSAEVATAVWTDLLAGTDFATASSVGKLLKDNVNATVGSRSTLTQTEVTGGAYNLAHASFAFNALMDFTTAQKAATLARVTLTDTVTTYTSNTPQTGDSYAIVNNGTHGNAAIKGYVDDIGVAGAGLTALGDTRLANLDATVTSRMASYTQPTGFLAATFPLTVASTTNITGASGIALGATQAAYAPAKAGDAMTLTAPYDLYHADIQYTVDGANTQDEYTLSWMKNGVRQTSGITVPTIQVVKRATGTDLIASTTPTQIGTTGSYKHDATGAARLTAGEAVLVVVTATIDGSTRSFSKLIGRDSTV
jgi:hypothetical protein